MNSQTSNQELASHLYQALITTAEDIRKIDAQLGFYARRKVDAASPTSELKVLIQIGDDINRMADKVRNS